MQLIVKIAGEIGTKSAPTRRRFLRALATNVRAAIRRRGMRATVEPRWSRVMVSGDGISPSDLTGIFGVHSISRAQVVPARSLEELVARAADHYRPLVAGRTFAVRARRSGEHPYRSRDVAVALGDELLAASAGVDLSAPDVEVPVEIVGEEAYLLSETVRGAGGLPAGIGGRAVALFSGGFDSPVAAWMAMRRGLALDLAVCDLGGCGQVDAALEVAHALADRWAPGIEPAAHIVDLAPLVGALRDRVDPSIRQVLLKRGMYRAGSLLAGEVHADALVTGESLGQVSTQTLRNLAVAEEVAGMPVLRPLVGMDKEEIMTRAREIGTHDASERVQEHCSIATGRVETAARLDVVVSAEGVLDEGSIAAAVGRARRIDLPSWRPGPSPDHVVESPPPGSVVVDVREPDEGPAAGDVRLPMSRLAEWAPTLEPSGTYVFVCASGRRSESVAHALRERGVVAYSLAGGVSSLPDRAA